MMQLTLHDLTALGLVVRFINMFTITYAGLRPRQDQISSSASPSRRDSFPPRP